MRTGILSWMVLALLALTSAVLCIAPPSLGAQLALFYTGAVYGVLLAVHFATCRGVRSPAKLITLVGVSTVSWAFAYFGSFVAAGFIPGGTVHRGDAIDPAFPLIAFGGALGGVALLPPVLLLLKPSSVSSGAAFTKAFLGILLSAIVGGIAWQLGPTLGAAIWALLPSAPLPRPESYGMAALFLVWQPVIALFIGWATTDSREYVPTGSNGLQVEGSARAPLRSGGLSLGAFVLIVVSLFALSLTRIIPVRLRLAHRERAVAQMRGSRPSAVDVPLVQPMSEEDALILRAVEDYHPDHTMKTMEAVSHDKGFERPGDMYFTTVYTKTGKSIQGSRAPMQYISVVVQQYPNSAWAQYFAEYPRNMYISFDDPRQHAIVTQFNYRVRSSQLARSPGQTWNLYYMWPSSNCVITVDYHTPDETLGIVRAYLEKYPSSIP